jgi:tetratricopeptide (TPR) repeat protein
LEGSLSAIYNLRISNLSDTELHAAIVISAFDINVEQKYLATLLSLERQALIEILSTLQFNNIILPVNINPAPVITSVGLRKHLYSLIDVKKEFHKKLTEIISNKLPTFNKSEFARQYELSEQYEKAYSIWLEEIELAKELSAYSYIRIILEHLIKLPLNQANRIDAQFRLVETFYNQSDFNSVLEFIEQVDIEHLPQGNILELYIIKGSSMINVGKLEEGRDMIKSLIPRVDNEKRKNKLLTEIAYAKFDLNKYDDASKLCEEIISKSEVSVEDCGRVHNLFGMCKIYGEQNTRESLDEFLRALECYKKSGLTSKVAAIEVNLGNVYNLLGDSKNAEIHWKRALDLNLSIGNIEQEGILLLNNGIYYFDKAEFEECLEYYKRAYKIFLSLGNKKNQGIALSNLGEVYLTTCDYQNAFDTLKESRAIFEATKNLDELIPVLLHFGYFYLIIDSTDHLMKLYSEVSALLNDAQLRDKYRIEISLLAIFKAVANNEEIEIEELKHVRSAFFKREDVKNYVTVSTILVNYLIKLNLFAEALEELNHPQFIDVCSKNHVYNANREYMLGKVSSFIDDDSTLSQLDHLEKAYALLSDESIVELTWQVLFALAQSYGERGNIGKAKNFIIYTRDIINLIAENIQTTQFKTAYLQKDERRAAMEKLVDLERV